MKGPNVCLLLAVLMLPGAVAAKPQAGNPSEYRFKKKIDPADLQTQLAAAGFAVSYIECSGLNCTIHLKPGEKKNPASVVDRYVFVDRAKVLNDNLESIRNLSVKFDAGTLSQVEKDELLRRLVRHVAGF